MLIHNSLSEVCQPSSHAPHHLGLTAHAHPPISARCHHANACRPVKTYLTVYTEQCTSAARYVLFYRNDSFSRSGGHPAAYTLTHTTHRIRRLAPPNPNQAGAGSDRPAGPAMCQQLSLTCHLPPATFPAAGHVLYCVLDEADKMLGLGFQPQIQQLKALLVAPAGAEQDVGAGAKKQKEARRVQVGRAPPGNGRAQSCCLTMPDARANAGDSRVVASTPTPSCPSPPACLPALQVGLFTATMPESLEEVAAEWLHRPQRVQITAADASISKSITQVGACCTSPGVAAGEPGTPSGWAGPGNAA